MPYSAPNLETNMEAILADVSISITELKRNPSAVIEAADGESVAVLVHNKPSAYLVPAATYKRLMARLEDPELADRKRVVSGKRVSVRVDLGGRGIIQKKRKNIKKINA